MYPPGTSTFFLYIMLNNTHAVFVRQNKFMFLCIDYTYYKPF